MLRQRGGRAWWSRALPICGVAAIVLLFSSTSPADIIFPSPGGPTAGPPHFTSLQFGDFTIYSLNYLDNLTQANPGLLPDDRYVKRSAPGQIRDDIVIATGAGGDFFNNNLTGVMDNPYGTPSGAGDPPYFNTAYSANGRPVPTQFPSVPPPDARWGASVPALRSFLQGDPLLFFFNLNQDNASATRKGADPNAGYVFPNDQDLVAWARVQLIDNDNHANDKTYFLLALGQTTPNSPTGPDETVDASTPAGLATILGDTDWARVHGAITVAAEAGLGFSKGDFLHFGPPGSAPEPLGLKVEGINQNLGQDLAAFAAYNEDLALRVRDASLGYDELQMDVKFALLNDGYEQLFIQQEAVQGFIPEPASVVIWSVLGAGAAAGLAIRRRRRAPWTEESRRAIYQVIQQGHP